MEQSIRQCFDHEFGSSVWPSDDPKDSPFDKFTCKICNKKLSIQMYGRLYMGQPSFEEMCSCELRNHLMNHTNDDFKLKSSNVNLLTANYGFDLLLIKEINKNENPG